MIYTTGTIAINDNTVTGTGTNFSEPLSLIRVGCTLISVGDPVQIFTITEIKSSTELSVTPAADPAIPAGTKFSILLSDSISVDGLAQDVAETLRYYQGRETEISEALDFFKNFNLQELKDLVKQSEDSANAAKTSEENAAQSERSALDIKNQTEQLKNETRAARDEAGLAMDNANTHANDAKSAKDAAEIARNDAEQFAKQINPENLLHKDKNLSDIADRAAAWLNVRPIGSTPLAGDPVNDHDATTKRWVQNMINTGTVGPTMNGVMNYGVGDFHLRDSRAYIQPYEVVADGQLLNRADWPELWAYAQMLSPITEEDWLTDPFKRGKYSTGDGSTTFRVPDLNGVQSGSIDSLYGRGDGGISSLDGTVIESGAPDIQGAFRITSLTTVLENTGQEGAFFNKEATYPYANLAKITADGSVKNYPRSAGFAASRSSPVYGRSSTEVRPKSFIGVWVIRASGGFVAANTAWSVINGDATRPVDGTIVEGGNISSLYKVNGVNEAEASVHAIAKIGGSYYARISVKNNTANRSAYLDLSDDGALTAPHINSKGGIDSKGGVLLYEVPYPAIAFRPSRYTSPDTQLGAFTKFEVSGQDGEVAYVSLSRHYGTGSSDGAIYVLFPNTGGTLALQGTSGINYKKNIVDADANEALDRITGQRLVNFVYKDDEQERVRFGIIAEEAELIAPQYIKHNRIPYEDIIDEDGNKIGEKTRDRPSVDVNPIVMDLMGCVQALNAKIAALEAEIAELKASK